MNRNEDATNAPIAQRCEQPTGLVAVLFMPGAQELHDDGVRQPRENRRCADALCGDFLGHRIE
jgi:hypothetical protein